MIIKPNICTINDNTGYSVTHTLVVEAIVDLLFHHNSNLSVKIVESDSQSKWANEAFTKFGYTDLVERFQNRKYDIELVNLSDCKTEEFHFQGEYFTNPELADMLKKIGYIISIAQAKTHYLTSITGVLKNLFGFLPQKKQGFYHPNVNEVIVDLNRLFPINLSIIDARVGVHGWNGPKTTPLGKFILGHKPVSVDAILAQLMNLEPNQIQHLVQSQKYGLGTINPKVIYDSEMNSYG
ncbi:MAG: DUF362 domain-containing protein [Promethearchaeota archaeon]